MKELFIRWVTILYMMPMRIVCRLKSTAIREGQPRALQPIMTPGQGVVKFHGKVYIGCFPSPYFFGGYAHIEARNKGAVIEISDGSWINNNFVAIANHTTIKIGKRVLIGPNVLITDSDFHGVKPEDRSSSASSDSKAVHIQNDVFIGSNVTVLKGVTIGSGSVIGSNSIITKNIPCDVVAAGNPAKVIKRL